MNSIEEYEEEIKRLEKKIVKCPIASDILVFQDCINAYKERIQKLRKSNANKN